MAEHQCVVCQKRPYDRAQVCAGCRLWLDRTLVEIVELYALLPANLAPGRHHGQRVSGSREAPLPLRVDPLDLLMPAPSGRQQWTNVQDAYRDQIGHTSVASVLDSWARDWRSVLCMREGLPWPNVRHMATWLRNRLEDACNEHPAIDEFANEMRDLRRALRNVVGVNEVQPEHLDVPCRRCDLLDLHRLPGQDRVECGSCGDLLTEDEFTRWTKMIVADIRSHMKALVEFLRSRLDEDEAKAIALHAVGCGHDVVTADAACDCDWHVSRSLAEVAAKRELLKAYVEAAAWYDANKTAPAGELHGLYTALQHITLPFADHPEYDEAWRP